MTDRVDRDGPAGPRVTVLMAVYNGERYLRQSIESILRQTHIDFEFLIINDGSTDGSRGIVLSYGDPRIRLVDNPENVGLTKSLNRGLSLARAPLVARQDADDVSRPERLGRQAAFLDANPDLALLGAQVRNIDARGRPFRAAGWEKATTEAGIRWQFLFDSPFAHTSVMFRRDVVWGELGGYDERFVTSQDYEMWTRVSRRRSVRNLPDILVDFRTHPDAVSARYTSEDVRRVEGVIRENVARILGPDSRFDGWPALWAAVVNAGVAGDVSDPGHVVGVISAIHERFVERHPEAAGNGEIRRHMAGKLAFVACRLATGARGSSLRAFAGSFRADPRVAWTLAPKYLALLAFGNAARRASRRLRGLGDAVRGGGSVRRAG